MAVQRDQNNTYYVDFKVKDSSGTWRHICKRGFKTLKDAKKWEAEYRKNPPVKSEPTLKTYTHLLASSDQQMMDKINSYREGKNSPG